MTHHEVPVDDPEVLHRTLAATDVLFLDFDGPVCSVFAGIPDHHVAAQLRDVLTQGGHTALPAEVEKTSDPFDVLRYAAKLGDDEARYAETALRAHEVEAIATATPTPGAHDLMRHWRTTGRPLAIISNNSTAAIDSYLHLHQLTGYVHLVSARTEPDPRLLKPNPHLLEQAIRRLAIPAQRCALVGDSITDLQAANAVSATAIGYANKPDKATLFVTETPAVITTSMTALDAEARLL